MIELSDLELGYAAGLFDGEGSVIINKSTKDRKIYRLFCSVGNTNLLVLGWMKDRFGGELHANILRVARKEMYSWRIHGHEAARFLAKICRYLITKREQALVALKFQSIKLSKKSFRLTDEEHHQEQEYADQIKLLNQKGSRSA